MQRRGRRAYVELEGLGLGVVVADPRDAAHVARLLARVDRAVRELEEDDEAHNLQPAERRHRGVRVERAARHVLELEVERLGEVAREADAGLRREDAGAREHRDAAVLDLELLVAAVRAARVLHRLVEAAEGT